MGNDNVGEIVIVDDASNEDIFEKVKDTADYFPKIKLFRNEYNIDCFYNKKRAIELTTNDWTILLDSDNVINFDYLFHVFQNINWQEDTAYLPSFAAPHFDYRKYEGLTITKENVHKYMDDPDFRCCLNTANYFVNRKFYLKCWDGSINPHTSDSIYMNYLWLKNGGKLYIVPGLTYQHRVDNHGEEESGHYQKNNHKTGNFHQEVEQLLKALR
jgi:glycosyltransferase involved in cell wall biosynthesis